VTGIGGWVTDRLCIASSYYFISVKLTRSVAPATANRMHAIAYEFATMR